MAHILPIRQHTAFSGNLKSRLMKPQELDTLDLNEALAEILQAHGYACQTQGEKILPDFAVPV